MACSRVHTMLCSTAQLSDAELLHLMQNCLFSAAAHLPHGLPADCLEADCLCTQALVLPVAAQVQAVKVTVMLPAPLRGWGSPHRSLGKQTVPAKKPTELWVSTQSLFKKLMQDKYLKLGCSVVAPLCSRCLTLLNPTSAKLLFREAVVRAGAHFKIRHGHELAASMARRQLPGIWKFSCCVMSTATAAPSSPEIAQFNVATKRSWKKAL